MKFEATPLLEVAPKDLSVLKGQGVTEEDAIKASTEACQRIHGSVPRTFVVSDLPGRWGRTLFVHYEPWDHLGGYYISSAEVGY